MAYDGYGNLRAAQRSTVIVPDECWRLVGRRGIGRIAFATPDERIEILPVSYVVDDRRLYVRTSAFGPIARNVDGRQAAFEIDALDVPARTGWSVVVRGRGYRVTDSETLAVLWAPTQPAPWVSGARGQWVGMVVDEISGRSFAD